MMLRIFLVLIVFAAPVRGESFSDVLDRAGKRAERFADEFASVKCTEKMTQAKLDDKGKPQAGRTSDFDYLIFIRVNNGPLKVEESRLKQGKAESESSDSLLVTGGFATLALVFHPLVRDNYVFEDLSEDAALGLRLRKIRFELKPGARSMAVLRLKSRNYPIEWQGTAWVDAATGDVHRIHANLKSDMADVGLRSLDTEVDYAPVKFAEVPGPLWLPRSASIEAETLRQHWRNRHEFRDYRLFSVTTSTREATP